MTISKLQKEKNERIARTFALMCSGAKSHKCQCGTMIFMDAEEERAFKAGKLKCAVCGSMLGGSND
ncbi:MAG: hypothetical protein ACRCXK_12610 [Wohlfahrtiimonas sp.]